ncbi:hypothetical protein B1748_05170 [Paenibacillus sp. MY03]|uniref:hypothetical protein n=1 Tax=Paenibacillus sp. MY03 TaxID=302980 RepID=UPI000B3D3C6D|nr:hypothetical protein [Paenibacillus sp. MY03]OUS78151.1 hypothetical protein B1748_05170 [Paenibacillus sp. MY03]
MSVETAVAEVARLGMSVILYDEAMYPSGSASDMVVRRNPEYTSRGLQLWEFPCTQGVVSVLIELEPGEILDSAQAVRKLSDTSIEHIMKQPFATASPAFISRRLPNGAAHGIALTGHPALSDEIGLLEHFHIPGQDVVCRYIAPEIIKRLREFIARWANVHPMPLDIAAEEEN